MTIKDRTNKGEIYTTFSFDGIDSSQIGAISVSSSGTYSTNILPAFTDNSLTVDGYNGKYYFNTQTTEKVFTFTCFIEKLSVGEFDQLKTWIRQDKIGKLIVPETPFRFYWVKLSSIDNLGNIPLTHELDGGICYTGTFNVTFTTIGQPVGYGMFYYKDDLKYYEYHDIYNDANIYIYDTGLLYKEESLPLKHKLSNGITNLGLYNPGTYQCRPKLIITALAEIRENDEAQLIITNQTNGDVSVINLRRTPRNAKIVIDYEHNTSTKTSELESKSQFSTGDLITLSPREYVERFDDATIFPDMTDPTHTRVRLDRLARQVREGDLGKYVMFKNQQDISATYGAGGIVGSIDSVNNDLILKTEKGYTNANVSVIITKLDILEHSLTLPEGMEIEIEYEMSPRYI